MAESQLGDYLERARSLAPVIRAHAARSERESRLAPEIVEALHQSNLYRLFLPRDLNGGGLTIPGALRVFEEVSRADASTGWNLVSCGDGPVFAHFLERDAFEEIFREPRAVLAGSANPMGIRAEVRDGGWEFSGCASVVSGCAQATWLMVVGLEFRDGKPHFDGSAPVMRTGVFPIQHAKILDTWDTSGMRGTGSHDCTFEGVFVPRAFTSAWPNPKSTWAKGAFGHIPLTTLLGGGLSIVALGAAQHMLDAFTELALKKVPMGSPGKLRERLLAQVQLAQAAGLVCAAREYLYSANDEIWRRGEAGESFDSPARAAARLASVTVVKLCEQAADLLHDAAGITVIQSGQELERCWRDLHALSQHVLLGTPRLEAVGRIMLGLDPGSPII